MSIFRYYLPGVREVTEHTFREFGLAERFRDCLGRLWHHRTVRQAIANGPDGGEGFLVYPESGEQPLWKSGAYESQLSDNGKFWIVWPKDDLPGPEGLKRLKTVAGVDVEMLDDRIWHCPTIRKMLAIPGVPCVFSRKKGELQRQPASEYRALWEQSLAWCTEYFSGHVPHESLLDAASQCLAVNYRVGDEEIGILGLFDEAAMVKVMETAIDVAFLEDQKKRALVESLLAPASSHGSEDSIPDTESRLAS